jgi:hypothetical protein
MDQFYLCCWIWTSTGGCWVQLGQCWISRANKMAKHRADSWGAPFWRHFSMCFTREPWITMVYTETPKRWKGQILKVDEWDSCSGYIWFFPESTGLLIITHCCWVGRFTKRWMKHDENPQWSANNYIEKGVHKVRFLICASDFISCLARILNWVGRLTTQMALVGIHHYANISNGLISIVNVRQNIHNWFLSIDVTHENVNKRVVSAYIV